MYLLPHCEVKGNVDGVSKVNNLDEHVIMAFDVQMWCVLCAGFDLDALLLCHNVVQCFCLVDCTPCLCPFMCPFCVSSESGKCLLTCCVVKPGHVA
jgi:hypothetical protein